MECKAGDVFGKWILLYEKPKNKGARRFRCRCSCGNEKDVHLANLIRGKSKSCGCQQKNIYKSISGSEIMSGSLSGGYTFFIDKDDYELVKNKVWYPSKNGSRIYVIDSRGLMLHQYLLNPEKGYEVDHIDLNTLNNCRSNLRICSHQQNQCNQPLQKNNSSGVSGVSFYKPRGKYRARIKVSQTDIHLGYFDQFIEAVQARNEAIKLMFGEYGRYNDVPEASESIKQQVYAKCSRHFDKAAIFIDHI